MALITYETLVIPWHVRIGVEENSCDLCTYLGYLCVYANTPPQFHMAKPNGIGKNRKRHVET